MKGRSRAKGSRRALVLVFGEDDHDRRAISRLASGLRPELYGCVEARRTPLVLIKNANPGKARSNAEQIARLVRQESAARDVIAVLAHQDCDELEPAHESAAASIEKALGDAGCPGTAIAVTPAWELESWWLLFPEAVAPVVKGWRTPDNYLGRDIGQVRDSKEALTRAVRPSSHKTQPRPYAEADSISIAENIVKLRLLQSFDGDHRETRGKGVAAQRTRSASFGAFRRKVLRLAL